MINTKIVSFFSEETRKSLPGYDPVPAAVVQSVSSVDQFSLVRWIGPTGGVCPLCTAISASTWTNNSFQMTQFTLASSIEKAWELIHFQICKSQLSLQTLLPVSVVSILVWLCLSCGPMSMMAFSTVPSNPLTSSLLSRWPGDRMASVAVKSFCPGFRTQEGEVRKLYVFFRCKNVCVL